MSDPIAEDLYKLGHWNDRKIVDRLAKQFRQQVGRELLEKSNRDNDSDIWDLIETIREVCKLENSDE